MLKVSLCSYNNLASDKGVELCDLEIFNVATYYNGKTQLRGLIITSLFACHKTFSSLTHFQKCHLIIKSILIVVHDVNHDFNF